MSQKQIDKPEALLVWERSDEEKQLALTIILYYKEQVRQICFACFLHTRVINSYGHVYQYTELNTAELFIIDADGRMTGPVMCSNYD